MFKKILVIATLVCALPALANAWTLNTWAKSKGGTITSLNGAAQTVLNGSVYKAYPDATVSNATATADAGYTISKTTCNGVSAGSDLAPLGLAAATCDSGNANAPANFLVTFRANLVSVTAYAGTGAGVSPRSLNNVYYGQKVYTPIKFVFTPKTGYAVGAISGMTGTMTSATDASGKVTVTIPINFVFNAPISLTASPTNTSPIANAGVSQTVFPGTPVTLNGAASVGATSYAWTQTSGPAVTLVPAGSNATFTPAVVGSYQFKLTVDGGSYATTNVIVATSATLAVKSSCVNCHTSNGVGAAVYDQWSSGKHKANNVLCANCHVGANGPGHPGTVSSAVCSACHTAQSVPLPAGHTVNNDCMLCHTGSSSHQAAGDCISCHEVAVNAGAGFVQDNNGVRAILPEFTKRSHHITGATPTNAQCVVCHLEGKVVAGSVVVDSTKHMADANIHLRNADDNTDYVWTGSTHTAMDNFCFSCHDANGATGLATAGLNAITGGTAANPFGDTLKNGYDQVARASVVDVKTAFTTTNASHHAVSGQRYKYRFSTLDNAAAWSARNGKPMPAASEIAEGHLDLDGNPIEFVNGEESYDPAGPEEGGHATLYEGDKFVATYIPLGASQNVADNSTLHCGDCHTVGQWKSGSSTNADGTATFAAIGAHGSANEYLLRNSLGTDAIHNQLTYVCFNCHAAGTQAATAASWAEQVAEGLFADSVAPVSGSALNPLGKYIPTPVPTWKAGWNALHPTVYPGQLTGYYTAHAVSAMHAQCQADSADNITSVPNRGFNNFSSNRLQRSWSPQAVKIYDYSPASGATAAAPLNGSNAASGNITGIACTNCHNSGLRNGFGGIHGGNATYTDGLGRTQKSYRFMPGMGNYRYAPPGGWDGKDVSDATLLTANNPLYPGTPGNRSDQSVGFPGASGKPMGGCYTNGGSGAAGSDLNNLNGVTYGVCNHHGTSTAASAAGAPFVKTTTTGATATFRATYGGGTTGNPTTYEPTVREATAGGTLVTRPLKY